MWDWPQYQVYHQLHTCSSNHILFHESLYLCPDINLRMSQHMHELPLIENKPIIQRRIWILTNQLLKRSCYHWEFNTFSRGPARRKCTPLGLSFWTTIWRTNLQLVVEIESRRTELGAVSQAHLFSNHIFRADKSLPSKKEYRMYYYYY